MEMETVSPFITSAVRLGLPSGHSSVVTAAVAASTVEWLAPLPVSVELQAVIETRPARKRVAERMLDFIVCVL